MFSTIHRLAKAILVPLSMKVVSRRLTHCSISAAMLAALITFCFDQWRPNIPPTARAALKILTRHRHRLNSLKKARLQRIAEKDLAANPNHIHDALSVLSFILLAVIRPFARVSSVYFWLQLLLMVTLFTLIDVVAYMEIYRCMLGRMDISLATDIAIRPPGGRNVAGRHGAQHNNAQRDHAPESHAEEAGDEEVALSLWVQGIEDTGWIWKGRDMDQRLRWAALSIVVGASCSCKRGSRYVQDFKQEVGGPEADPEESCFWCRSNRWIHHGSSYL